jgi:phage shock protein C
MSGVGRGGRLDGMEQHTAAPSVNAAGTPSDIWSGIEAATGSASPGSATTGPATSAPAGPGPSTPAAPRFTLRRSSTDRLLGGVCGGLAASLGADPALLRVLAVALTLVTGGAAAVVYLAAWALAPDDRPAP